ncbi:hypothetical protein D3C84_385070 [compost metagenome]
MQTRRAQIQRRRLCPGLELTLRGRTLVAWANGDVVTFDQGFQASDACQRNRRLDHPELCTFNQIVFSFRVKGDFGRRGAEVRVDLQGLERADLDAFVHDRRATGLQSLEVAQLDLDADPRLGSVEIFVQTERQARIGRRAVLTVFRCGESDTTGHDARQRFAAYLYPGQVGIDADATGVPEARMFTHEVGVSGLDEDFQFHRVLVIGQGIAFHPANFDLLVEHRAVTIERPQAIGLERQVQAGLAIGKRRCGRQRREFTGRLSVLTWADGNVVARHQGFQTGDPGQADAGLDQPETGAGTHVRLGRLVHLDSGDDAFVLTLVIQRKRRDLADRHALENHFGLVGLNTFTTFEADLDFNAGLVVGSPTQPATDNQGDQWKDPNSRPIGGWAGFSRRQITHGRHPTPYYPKSVGDRKLLQQALSKSPRWQRPPHRDSLR